MKASFSDRDNQRSIVVVTYLNGFIKQSVKIKCHFDSRLVLPFADELRKYDIPSEDVTLNPGKQPGGCIIIRYRASKPNTLIILDEIRNVFINFINNERHVKLQDNRLGVGRQAHGRGGNR
jgi:hypothetical protein